MEFDPIPCVVCKHRITVRTASFNTLYKRGNVCVRCQSKQRANIELAEEKKREKKRGKFHGYHGSSTYKVWSSNKGNHKVSKQAAAQKKETDATIDRLYARYLTTN
jgi:hypothetical protein